MTDTNPQLMTDGELDNWRRALAASPEDLWSVTKCAIELFVATIDAERTARLAAEAERDALLGALQAAWLIRPSNWDDDDDPDQAAAWRRVEAALAALAGQEGGK